MCFGEVGPEGQRLLCQPTCLHQLCFAQRLSQPMTPQLAYSQLRDGQREVRIERDRFLVPARRLVECFRPEIAVGDTLFELALEEKIISLRIFRWGARHRARFGWR